jgi:Mn2+/Fe2+ NRAMP family transporter
MLGVPVLAGSGAYAVAEAMHWRGSLDDRPRAARKFYAVLAAAVALGLALDVLGLNAVRMLFWAAVVNGVLAPPLLVLVVLLSSDPKVMGQRVNPPLLRLLGWAAVIVMFAASAAMPVMWLW